MQKAHLHIVVQSIPHYLATFWSCDTYAFIVLRLDNKSELVKRLITTISNFETKIFHSENVKA